MKVRRSIAVEGGDLRLIDPETTANTPYLEFTGHGLGAAQFRFSRASLPAIEELLAAWRAAFPGDFP